MKALLVAMMFLFSISANADEEFKLKFEDPTQIILDRADWELVAKDAVYNLHINKFTNDTKAHANIRLHSMVEYHDPEGYKFDALSVPVKRIFTFGVLNCDTGTLFMLTEWFTDKNNQVVYVQTHEPTDYAVDMVAPGTARYQIYVRLCGGKRI
jgi:hypothetical protein